MQIGDPVIYYTHESWDSNHRVNDSVGIVTKVWPDGSVNVTVFPGDGPLIERYEQVTEFDSGTEGLQPGGRYYRAPSEDPPDFGAYFNAPAPPKEPEPEPPADPSAPPADRRF